MLQRGAVLPGYSSAQAATNNNPKEPSSSIVGIIQLVFFNLFCS